MSMLSPSSQLRWLRTELCATQTPALHSTLPPLQDLLDRSLYDPDLIWNTDLIRLLYNFAEKSAFNGGWHWRAYLRTLPTAHAPLDLAATEIKPHIFGSAVMLLRRVRIELPDRMVRTPGHITMLMLNRAAAPPAVGSGDEDAMDLDSPREAPPPPPLLGPQDVVRSISQTNRVWQVQDMPAIVHVKFSPDHMPLEDYISLKLIGTGAVALILPLNANTKKEWHLKLAAEFKLQMRPVPDPAQVEFFREYPSRSGDYLAYRVAKVCVDGITVPPAVSPRSPRRRSPHAVRSLSRSATPPRRNFSPEDLMSISSPSYVSPSPPTPRSTSTSLLLTRSSPSPRSPSLIVEDPESISLLKTGPEFQSEVQQRHPRLNFGASLFDFMAKPRMVFSQVPGTPRYRCVYDKKVAHFIGPCVRASTASGDAHNAKFYFLVLNKSVPHIIRQVSRSLSEPERQLQQSLHRSTLPPGWMVLEADPNDSHSIILEMMAASLNEFGEYLARNYGENCGWGMEALLLLSPPPFASSS
jgi:hypothetical protein